MAQGAPAHQLTSRGGDTLADDGFFFPDILTDLSRQIYLKMGVQLYGTQDVWYGTWNVIRVHTSSQRS